MAYLTDETDMEKLTAAITIKVTPEHKAVLERLALHDGVTVSDLMRGVAVRLVNEKHEQHLSLAAIFGGIALADKS